MKLVLLAAMAALMNAQASAAEKPAEPTKTAAPTERKFTVEEIDKLSLWSAQQQVIADKNKAKELEESYRAYQQEIAPIAAKQKALIHASCLAVGVPENEIDNGGCGAVFGFDPSGKPIMGQDGKPVESRVWRVVKPVVPAGK